MNLSRAELQARLDQIDAAPPCPIHHARECLVVCVLCALSAVRCQDDWANACVAHTDC